MTTLVTAAQISQLRRMVAEPLSVPYTDPILIAYIEKYPHIDAYGESALDEWGVANADWTPTYDLAAAAADVWEEKASGVAAKFDFAANGGNYSQSQQYKQYMKQCRHYRARRLPSTMTLVKSPRETTADESYIGNLPESD
jgi:hypothetical protein